MKKLLVSIFAGLFFLGAGIIFAEPAAQEDELYSAAQQAFEDGFHDLAIKYLVQFKDQFPSHPKLSKALVLLGQCYYFKNDFSKALDVFNAIAQQPVSDDDVLFWRAETNIKLGSLDQARLDYSDLLERFPSSEYIPQALYSLGWSYFDQKDYVRSTDAFLKLITRFPRNPLCEDALLKIGEGYYNAGDYANAVKTFNQYLLSYPQSLKTIEVTLNIADAYYYNEDFNSAFIWYDKLLRLTQDPNYVAPAYNGKIWSAIKKKMFETAQKTIKDALAYAESKSLDNQDFLLARANIAYEEGDMSAALSAYEDAIKSHPDGTLRDQMYLGRANVYFAQGKYSQARDDFKFVIDHQQEQSDREVFYKAGLGLGWSFAKLGDIAKAERQFKAAADATENTKNKDYAMAQLADMYHDAQRLNDAMNIYVQLLKSPTSKDFGDYLEYRLGILLLKGGKYEAALNMFEQMKKTYPQSSYQEDVNYYLGVIAFKMGNWDKAVSRMQNFLNGLTRPSDFAPHANYILALSFLNTKQPEEALKTFQKILRLYPENFTVAQNADLGIAKCQFELGAVKEAVKRFKMIVYKYPKTPIEQEALLWLAQFAMKNGQYEEAIQNYNLILEHFPESNQKDQVNYELAQAYEANVQPDLALERYNSVSRLDKALYAKVQLSIAGILSKEFEPQKAIEAYETIIRTNPQQAREAYMRMGQIYRNNQNYENEIHVYERALKSLPGKINDAEFQFNIADVYEAMGQKDLAIEAYLRIPSLYPKSKDWIVKAYLRVAKIFEEDRKWEGARVTYQKIIQLNAEESAYAQERLEAIRKK